MSKLADFLAGRNPFGTSGLDVERSRGQFQSGMTSGDVDPRLRNYFYVEPGDSTRWIVGGPTGSWDDFQRQGYIQLGSNLGGVDEEGLVNDWSKLQYSPEFGVYTQQSNVNSPNSWLDQAMPAIMALAAGGIGASYAGALGAAGSGAGAGEAAGTGAFDIGGSSGFGGSTAIDSGAGGGLFGGGGGAGGLGESGAFDMGGSSGFGGSTAIDSGAAGGSLGGLGEGGGLDPETWAGNGGMSVNQNGLGSWNSLPWQDRLAGAINNPGSLFSDTGLLAQGVGGNGGLLSGSPSSILQNLARGYSLLGMTGLLNRGGGGGSKPSGGGGGEKGGSGQPLNLGAMQGQYRPNPFNVMQMQNFKSAVPRGMGGY